VEAREHYIEVGYVHFHTCTARANQEFSSPSALRHLDSVIDPKYVGIKTSRKRLEEDNSLGTVLVDSPEQSESASQFVSSEGTASEEDEGEEKVQSPGKEEDASEDEQPAPTNNQDIQENSSHENDLATTVRRRRDEDRKKGRAVTKQLVGSRLLSTRAQFTDRVTAIRVFGTVYSMPVYVYKSLSQRLIDCLP
jgi:protein AATF/BFR2